MLERLPRRTLTQTNDYPSIDYITKCTDSIERAIHSLKDRIPLDIVAKMQVTAGEYAHGATAKPRNRSEELSRRGSPKSSEKDRTRTPKLDRRQKCCRNPNDPLLTRSGGVGDDGTEIGCPHAS